MKILDSEKLERACHKVIDALSEFEPEYKIASLKMLIDTFPKEYIMIENPKKCTCKEPVDDWDNNDKHICVRCGGEL